jgi:glycosyltransferase 2 family protein
MDHASASVSQTQPARRLPAWVTLVLRVAATVALMAVVLRGIEWQKLLALLEQCDWRWWFAGFLVNVLVQMVAAVRWAALARPIGFPFHTLTFVWRFFEGLFFNLCLPSSIGGDVVKACRLADSTPGRLLAGCTVLADRLTGLAALGVLAGTALLAKEWSLATPAALAVGAVFLGTALLVFWLVVGSLDRVLDLIPEQHAARHFIGQLLPYTMRPSLIMRAVGWSLLVQTGGSLVVALIARALGVALPLSVWFAVVPLVALTMVVPVSISGVGVREGGLAFLLKPVGVSTDAAVAIGLLWFLATIVTGLIGGLLFLLDRRPAAVPAAAMNPAQPA